MLGLGKSHRYAALCLGTCAGLLALLVGCDPRTEARSAAAGSRPNILFILVDTLRADRLGCYGHDGGLSPLMDELAREGVVFDRTIATAPWTLPSVASYFCGYYPTVHKVVSYREALESARGAAGAVRYFGDEFTTLAELLQANGYLTAGFSANPFITRKFGFAQGFDHFDSTFAANETHGNVVNAAALRWLAQRDRSKPFFLYLHYMDVHDPYKAGERYVEPLVAAVEKSPSKTPLTEAEKKRHVNYFRKSAMAYQSVPRHRRLFGYVDYWRARYDSGVPQVDQYLQELRAKLTDMGLWDDAYVILTADHGESLGEHQLWAHGLSAHQDQLHVPLILRWPGELPAGKRLSQTVRLFDIMPTLLAQLEIAAPEGIQARSLHGLIAGDTLPPLAAFAEAVKKQPGQKALVLGTWKLLAYTEASRYELYDLGADPTEQQDLAAQQPERVADLQRLLERQIEENEALGSGVAVQEAAMTAAELERLRALGYIGGDEEPNEPEVEGEASPPGP
jgi:arylsulfatase A-like enzyme